MLRLKNKTISISTQIGIAMSIFIVMFILTSSINFAHTKIAESQTKEFTTQSRQLTELSTAVMKYLAVDTTERQLTISRNSKAVLPNYADARSELTSTVAYLETKATENKHSLGIIKDTVTSIDSILSEVIADKANLPVSAHAVQISAKKELILNTSLDISTKMNEQINVTTKQLQESLLIADNVSMILTIITTVATILIMLLISYKLNRKFKFIMSKIERIGRLDFTDDRQYRGLHDEIYLIDGHLKKAKESLYHITVDLSRIISTLKTVVTHVSAITVDIVSSSDIAQQNLLSSASSMKEVDTSISEISAIMEEFTASSEEISSTLSEISIRNGDSVSNIETSIEASNSLLVNIVSVDSSIENVLTHNKELLKSFRDISNVLSTIKEISHETELLSFNATIEAARAGTAGNGFSAVAKYIRDLSDKTKKCVLTIESMVSTLQEDLTNLDSSINVTSSEAKAGVSLTKDTLETFTLLLDELKTLSSNTSSVTNVMSEVVLGIDSVNYNMINVANQSTQTLLNTNHVIDTTTKQVTDINNLTDEVTSLSGVTTKMSELIRKFKI